MSRRKSAIKRPVLADCVDVEHGEKVLKFGRLVRDLRGDRFKSEVEGATKPPLAISGLRWSRTL